MTLKPDDIRSGDRRALARAITLVESRRRDHRLASEELLEALLPDTGGAVRLGISGVPGVGKSTFIETFGLRLIEKSKKVAVLAVDPISASGVEESVGGVEGEGRCGNSDGQRDKEESPGQTAGGPRCGSHGADSWLKLGSWVGPAYAGGAGPVAKATR